MKKFLGVSLAVGGLALLVGLVVAHKHRGYRMGMDQEWAMQ
jgi:hypothetical protein